MGSGVAAQLRHWAGAARYSSAQSGRRRRVHRGVYAVAGAVLPKEGRRPAAVPACGEGAVLSHLSAAVHWDLLRYDAPRAEVTAPASRQKVPGIGLHRSRSLDAQDTTHQAPITTVHRTLLDIAARRPRPSPGAGADVDCAADRQQKQS